MVESIEELNRFPYSGHIRLMGMVDSEWQDTVSVSLLFGRRPGLARKRYLRYVIEGMGAERRPELTGGGLLRSYGGWAVLRSNWRMGRHLKGDERILGDSDFVESLLNSGEEQLERRYALQTRGIISRRFSGEWQRCVRWRPEMFCFQGSRGIGFAPGAFFVIGQ